MVDGICGDYDGGGDGGEVTVNTMVKGDTMTVTEYSHSRHKIIKLMSDNYQWAHVKLYNNSTIRLFSIFSSSQH